MSKKKKRSSEAKFMIALEAIEKQEKLMQNFLNSLQLHGFLTIFNSGNS